MSTEPASPLSDFDKLEKTSAVSKRDDTAAILESELQAERDQRRDERFLWIMAVVVLGDVVAFTHLPAAAAVMIFLMEIVLLIAVAKFLGVHWVIVFLERMFHKFIGSGGNKSP